MTRNFNEQIPIELMADGSVVLRLSNEFLTLEGRMAPETALNLARQILDLHEARKLAALRGGKEDTSDIIHWDGKTYRLVWQPDESEAPKGKTDGRED